MNTFGSNIDARTLGKVAVLMGGASAERDVSLMSGRSGRKRGGGREMGPAGGTQYGPWSREKTSSRSCAHGAPRASLLAPQAGSGS